MSELLTTLASISSSGFVRSVTPVEITIAASATSGTQALAASVDITRSVIFWGGFTTDDSGSAANTALPRVELTDASTVTAYRNTAAASTVTVRGTLVEFLPTAVESVQAGKVTLGSAQTSNTSSLTSAVATTRSAVFFLGATSSYGLNLSTTVLAGIDLTDGSTVTATRNAANSSTMEVGYAVVQFKPGVVNSVQKRVATFTSGNAAENDTISAVTPANTILLHNGCVSAGTTYSNSHSHIRLTDGTTVAVTRNGTAASSRSTYYTVLEFAAGVLASVERNVAAMSSGNGSADTTITSVDTAKAFTYLCGYLTSGTAYNTQQPTAKLLNATTVRSERGGTSNAATTSHETVRFAA